jgi:hypothetical protein
MKRTELLRQLDQEFDVALRENVRQRAALEDMKHRMDQFKEEEKQKVPKWIMYPKKTSSRYIIPGKWYRVEKFEGIGNSMATITTEIGNKSYTNLKGSIHIDGGDWELCYSDNPPEEKKADTESAVEILRRRANIKWSALCSGYEIEFLIGDINSRNYVAIINNNGNRFLLVGENDLETLNCKNRTDWIGGIRNV